MHLHQRWRKNCKGLLKHAPCRTNIRDGLNSFRICPRPRQGKSSATNYGRRRGRERYTMKQKQGARLLLPAIIFLGCLTAVASHAQSGLSQKESDQVKAQATAMAAEDLYDHGEADKAIEQWREAIQLDPGLARAHHDLGLALRDKKQAEEA